MRRIVTTVLVLVGIVHLVPLIGVISGERVAGLYGITVSEPGVSLLLRHRAVLFGLLGGSLVVAAFVSSWQAPALAVGTVSVGSFLLLAWMEPGYGAAIRRVVAVDVGALALLLVGIWAYRRARARAS